MFDFYGTTAIAWSLFLFQGGLIDDLVDGSLVSDCPLPCIMTQTHTEFLDEYKSYETFLDISFSSRVRVTKTDLVKPTLSGFLSEVGLREHLFSWKAKLFYRWADPWAFGLVWERFKSFSSRWIAFLPSTGNSRPQDRKLVISSFPMWFQNFTVETKGRFP